MPNLCPREMILKLKICYPDCYAEHFLADSVSLRSAVRISRCLNRNPCNHRWFDFTRDSPAITVDNSLTTDRPLDTTYEWKTKVCCLFNSPVR